jgi:hypothetical protein
MKQIKKIIIGLMTGSALMAVVYIYVDVAKNGETPFRVIKPVIEKGNENLTKPIETIMLGIERVFSAADMREILSSNLLLLLNQRKIDELTSKFDAHTLTVPEKAYIKGFYEALIRYGGRIYPEAGLILEHYIQGDGKDLLIQSPYFFESPVIKTSLAAGQKKSIIGPVYLKINDDPRIGYAINGFYIKNTPERKEIYQYIDLGTPADTEGVTLFEYRGIKAALPHRLIRVFEEDQGCKGFTVRIQERLGGPVNDSDQFPNR